VRVWTLWIEFEVCYREIIEQARRVGGSLCGKLEREVRSLFSGMELFELSWCKTSSLRLEFGQQEHICFDHKGLQGILPGQNTLELYMSSYLVTSRIREKMPL
jgi:hypothetical protein